MGWWALACRPAAEEIDPAPADADTDVDADTDMDADTDADTDADVVLRLPERAGLELVGLDGGTVGYWPWTTLLGADCGGCGGEGASTDGDGLLLAFTFSGPVGDGGVASLEPDLTWRHQPFGFPHAAARTPDGFVAVAETLQNRVVWIDDAGGQVYALDADTPDFPGGGPNGLDRQDVDGTPLLVVSHHDNGQISCWDVSTSTPTHLWTYPASGALRTPHGAAIRRANGQWWLVYAHTEGLDTSGSVGIAALPDPLGPPAYVADATLPAGTPPLSFFRGVELTEAGALWLVDSGSTGGADGRLFSAPLPDLEPSGASGAYPDLTYVELEVTLIREDLDYPFEGKVWDAPAAWREVAR